MMLITRSLTFSAVAQQFSTIAQTAPMHAAPGPRGAPYESGTASVSSYSSMLPMPHAAADPQIARFFR